MPQAVQTDTTPSRAARARWPKKQTPALSLAPQTHALPWPEGVGDPNAYGLVLVGNCMVPKVCDGETAIFSPAKKVAVGDVVALSPADGGKPSIKRVVSLPLWPVGTKMHPDSTVVAAVGVESLSPPQTFYVRIAELKAIAQHGGGVFPGAAPCGGGAIMNAPRIADTTPSVRFIRVQGDHMEPTLTARDYVAVVPTDSWHGDGLYLMVDPYGTPIVYRAQNFIGSHFEIWGDRPGSIHTRMTREKFLECMLGVVQPQSTCRIPHFWRG